MPNGTGSVRPRFGSLALRAAAAAAIGCLAAPAPVATAAVAPHAVPPRAVGPRAATAPTAPAPQQEPQAEPAPPPGSGLRVYLLTIGQGDAIWEKFGHNAIWIRDEARGVDVAYNYGMFSFDQPGFVAKLMRGRMEYWMGGFDAVQMANLYVEDNRTLWRQELELTPGQRFELARFLQENALPENRFYRYDYYRDNCSTRVRDALNRVMGGGLEDQLGAVPTGTTYRTHTQRLTADELLANAGLLLAMGHAADTPLTAWDESFIPMQLMTHVRGVTVPGPAGPLPLVRSEAEVFTADRPAERAAAPDRRLAFTLIGLLLAAVLASLARAGRTRRAPRIAWFVLAAAWSLAIGLLGTLITLLWVATDHIDTYRNENVLQAGPLSLLLAGLLVAAAFGKGARATHWLAVAVAALALTGFALQILPGLDQPNGEIIGLLLPVHLAIALSAQMAAGTGKAGTRST